MIRHWNKPGFLDKSYSGPLPQPGEVWEVRVIGMNPSRTVYFWLPVRKVLDAADNSRWQRKKNRRR